MTQQLRISRKLELLRGGTQVGAATPIVTVTVYNHSSGALARGDVVIWDVTNSTKDLIHVTTSTGGNDVDVLGMITRPVADGALGECQIFGPTDALKVDGTTDIAIGDRLATFTTAKIAQKSTTAGRFARAMEAYTANNSSGVIDAFITNLSMGAYTTE